MKDNFKSHCKNHFESSSLCETDVQKFMELQKSYRKLKGGSIWTTPWLRVAGMGAAMVLMAIGVFSMNTYYNTDITTKIAADIVETHNQNLFKSAKWDVETTDLNVATRTLSQRGIKLVPSNQTKNLKLKAGKICNLAGRKAAQLQMVNSENGKSYSVYQAPIPENLRRSGFQRVVKEIDGVKVIMWKEGGLLHGMAEGEVRAIPASNSFK